MFGRPEEANEFDADDRVRWWTGRRALYPTGRRLGVSLSKGPEMGSSRTQFMNRLVEFSDRSQLALELAYYPPYHSKYNRIERCWGILENHWNGTLLNSIETTLAWAKTMSWCGVAPIVHLLHRVYETGVRYQFYHALALFAVAYAIGRWPDSSAALAGWLFITGIILFSGSLYALSLTGIRVLGATTPRGGLALLPGGGAEHENRWPRADYQSGQHPGVGGACAAHAICVEQGRRGAVDADAGAGAGAAWDYGQRHLSGSVSDGDECADRRNRRRR